MGDVSVIGGRWVLFSMKCFLVKPHFMQSHWLVPMEKSWTIKMHWNFLTKSKLAKLLKVLFVPFLQIGTPVWVTKEYLKFKIIYFSKMMCGIFQIFAILLFHS